MHKEIQVSVYRCNNKSPTVSGKHHNIITVLERASIHRIPCNLEPNHASILLAINGNTMLKLDLPLLTDKFPSFTYSSSVRDLGVTLDSSLTFTEHISNLTRSCFFHLRRLRAIRRSVAPTVFTTIVHAFICSRVDYCNSLLMGLPKLRLSPLQSVLNATARLMARLPRFSHISDYMTEVLHWLPITSRIHYKILLLVSKSQLGLAPKYLLDFMHKPLSATSARPLRSTDRLDLFVPLVKSALAQCRAFAVTGPSTWNGLPPFLWAKLVSGISHASSRSLKAFLFPRGFHTESASE